MRRFGLSIAILTFGLALLCLLWGTIVVKLRSEREAEVESAAKTSANLARVLEEHTTRTMREADQLLLFVMDLRREQGTKLDLRRIMEDGPVINRVYTSLGILDEKGHLVADSQPFKPANLADREHFRAHVAQDTGQPFIGQPAVDAISAKPSIQLSRRINRPDLAFGGVAVVSIDPIYFSRFYSQLDVGQGGMITLVGRDGIVRANRHGFKPSVEQDTPRWAVFRHLKTSDSGSYLATSRIDGVERIFSYRALADYPLVVLVGIATDEALAGFHQRRRDYYETAGLVSLAILGFTVLLLVLAARRRRAEVERAQLAAIVENSNDAIISRTLDGTITSWNAAAERIFGYSAQEAIGSRLELIKGDDEDGQRMLANNERIRRGERVQPFETLRRTKDGRTVEFSVGLSPLHDHAGRLSGVAVVNRDISALKKAEAERAAAAAIVENSNDAIISRSLDRRILTWNPAAERLLGWSAHEAIGESILLIVPPERRGENVQQRDLVHRGLPVPAYDTVRLAKDGRRIDVSLSQSAIKNASGEVIAVSLVLQDISERKHAERALRESEQRFRAIFDHAGVGITIRPAHDRNRPWTQVNDHFCELLGYTREELSRLSTRDVTPPEEQEAAARDNGRLLRGEISNYAREKRIVRKDGGRLWVMLAVAALPDDTGRPKDFIAVYQDITERKRAEAEHARLAAIVESSADAIISRGLDGTIQSWNPAAELMFGWTAREAIGQPITIVVPPERRGELRPLIDRVIVGESIGAVESTHLRKDGTRIETSVMFSAIENEEGAVVAVSLIYRDITERKKAEEQISYLSQYDTLTGLPNRSLLRDRLDLAFARARRRGEALGVLLINLDRFKKVNESLGTDAGDELLRDVAERLRDSLREVDTIARFGGNEYAVLVEGAAKASDVTAIAEKLVHTLATPFDVRGLDVVVSASIGVAVDIDGTGNAVSLLENAENAMSRAQQEGGAGYQLYEGGPGAARGKRLELESRLRHALENGEITVHYQPKVSLRSGAITGVEALLRWSNPELGQVSPAQFIPIAEETGLIIPIGEWILHAACAQAKAWEEQGLPVQMAVNLSPRQFRQKDLQQRISTVLDATALSPEKLELEITESTAMANPDQAIAVLGDLRAIGVKLAVDDFGTGYSSLSYLKRLPLSRLKIDRAFVKDLGTNTHDEAIIRATIALAGSLTLDVTAEGVETEAQRAFLARAGCHEYQGYYFSRPLPAEEITAILRNPGRSAS